MAAPLTPHLQIYNVQITSTLSILHRLTGLLIGIGTVWFAVWLAALAAGPERYTTIVSIIGSVPGLVAMAAFTWALAFHLCTGIRHLVWDAGAAMDTASIFVSARLVIGFSIVLTLLVWGGAIAAKL